MDRLIDMHSACRKLNNTLSQNPDTMPEWNMATCLATWNQARKDRGGPRYVAAYHNYRLAADIGFVAVLQNSRLRLPPTMEKEAETFYKQFHTGKKYICPLFNLKSDLHTSVLKKFAH